MVPNVEVAEAPAPEPGWRAAAGPPWRRAPVGHGEATAARPKRDDLRHEGDQRADGRRCERQGPLPRAGHQRQRARPAADRTVEGHRRPARCRRSTTTPISSGTPTRRTRRRRSRRVRTTRSARVWIDLSKEHYGIHGTPEPSQVGHAQSHGCVRLTNWDVAARRAVGAPGHAGHLSDEAIRAAPRRADPARRRAVVGLSFALGALADAGAHVAPARVRQRRAPSTAIAPIPSPRHDPAEPRAGRSGPASAASRRRWPRPASSRTKPPSRHCATATWRCRSTASTATTCATRSPTRAAADARTRRSTSWRRATRRCARSRTAPSPSCSTARAAAGSRSTSSIRPSTFSYYYAHLDRYAPGLREGQTVAPRRRHRLRRQHRQRLAGRAAPALRHLPPDAGAAVVEGRADQSVPGPQVALEAPSG